MVFLDIVCQILMAYSDTDSQVRLNCLSFGQASYLCLQATVKTWNIREHGLCLPKERAEVEDFIFLHKVSYGYEEVSRENAESAPPLYLSVPDLNFFISPNSFMELVIMLRFIYLQCSTLCC